MRDLFFNIPARRKFLKTERTELAHIETLLKKLALSYFTIGFELIHNGKSLFRYTPVVEAVDQDRRIAQLLGKSFLTQCLCVDVAVGELRLHGWMGLPAYSRSQPDQQYFFVNQRVVRDKVISHAVKKAYQDVLHHGRHPAFILYFIFFLLAQTMRLSNSLIVLAAMAATMSSMIGFVDATSIKMDL